MSKKVKKRIKKMQREQTEFIDMFLGSPGTQDAHMLPMQQPWHQDQPWCWCNPTAISEHPITTAKVWLHHVQIH